MRYNPYYVMCNMKICKDWTDRSLKARLIGRNAVIQIELVALEYFQIVSVGFNNFL